MRSVVSQTLRALNRRSRSGQSILIIAMGFIGLVAFVGLATDTAILFVRYSTLRRAVDAAAIAAAGTARQTTNFGSLGAVAEQYIKIHGLDPLSVRVENCATEVDDWLTKHGMLSTPDNQKIAFTTLVSTPGEQLCTTSPQKLVRVDAQIDSQTTFLSLIGFSTIRLSASSVSQTGSLDVALLIDAGFHQAYDTRGGIGDLNSQVGIICQFDTVSCDTAKYTATQQQKVTTALDNFEPLRGYFDDLIDGYDSTNPTGAATKGTTVTSAHPRGSIRAECRQIADWQDSFSHTNSSGNPDPQQIAPKYMAIDANYYYGGCCDEPVTFANPGGNSDQLNWYIYSDSTKYQPPQLNTFNTGNLYSGQSPMDPTNPVTGGQRNFSTLICKPFKYVRDAARDFLNHFDFNDGDRAMLITFDDSVHELTANGEYNNPSDQVGNALPVFTNKTDAIIALNKYAGVEIAPSGSKADCLADVYPPYNTNGRYYPATTASDPSSSLPVKPVGNTWLYETVSTCADTNTGGAVLAGQSLLTNPQWIRRDSVWVMVVLSSGYPNRTPGLSGICVGSTNNQCTPSINGGQSASIHKINQPASGYGSPFGDTSYLNAHSNNFFGQSGFPWPPQNTVWGEPISKLTQGALRDPGFCPWYTFCDPTAGGYVKNYVPDQSPYPLYNYFYPDGNTYQDPNSTNYNTPGTPNKDVPNAVAYNNQYCTATEPNPIWWTQDSFNPSLPYNSNHNAGSDIVLCTSTNPDARHFCMNPVDGVIDPVGPGGAYAYPSNPNLCSTNYDAMDYARDMVDFAALSDFTGTIKGNSVAMYSIFFPHQTQGPHGDIGRYILGAKFMRYVADAGDNATIDNHVQGWYHQYVTGQQSYTPDPVPPDANLSNPYNGASGFYPKTPEDPCAKYDFREFTNEAGGPGSSTGPTTDFPNGQGYEDLYKYDCGNYYYANSSAAVDQAFLSIVNRLFTRLTH